MLHGIKKSLGKTKLSLLEFDRTVEHLLWDCQVMIHWAESRLDPDANKDSLSMKYNISSVFVMTQTLILAQSTQIPQWEKGKGEQFHSF